ncbi:hypothetical protein [Pleomorphomonas carboxyditropha]|uniref:hypothetical protein n=1 Tax=Pleomorphomonas carboxyditropha TaxID=2023338 RepID=UPI001054D72B|nr:hypothetical protein [Pleomorphomonas carboxyditropha]
MPNDVSLTELAVSIAEIKSNVAYMKEKLDKAEYKADAVEPRLRDIETKILVSESRSSLLKALSNPFVNIGTSVFAAVSAVYFKARLGF